LLQAICYKTRVPQRKTRARLNVRGTPASAQRRVSWLPRALGPARRRGHWPVPRFLDRGRRAPHGFLRKQPASSLVV